MKRIIRYFTIRKRIINEIIESQRLKAYWTIEQSNHSSYPNQNLDVVEHCKRSIVFEDEKTKMLKSLL